MNYFHKMKYFLEEKGYWEMLSYLFFGGLTTGINIVTFFIFNLVFHINWSISNVIAWIVSVIFAFITNKIWVFQSRSTSVKQIFWEFFKFVFYRVLSLGIDQSSMFLIVDVFSWSVIIGKLVSQVLVVIANYVFSKLFIFKKKS